MKTLVAAFVVALAPCLAEAGTTIYSDTFDSDSPGLNATPAGWSIAGKGTVDIIPSGSYGIGCVGGTGNCVDLDGSSGASGMLVSPTLSLTGGTTYVASFDLSGNQRIPGQVDGVATSFGAASSFYSVLGTSPFTLETLTFTPTASGAYHLSFLDTSANNVGAILDSVKVVTAGAVSAVPEPSTYALMIAGLGALAFASRRRRAPFQNIRL